MSADAFTGADLGPAVEAQIVKDMLRRTWPILPAVVLIVAIVLIAGCAALNVDEFSRTSVLSLGFTTVQVPLGLVMLVLLAAVLLVFLATT